MQHTPKAGPPSTCLQRALKSTFRVENKLIANNMVFSGLASFRSTIFNDDAMFGTTIFLHDANFAQTQWNGSCFFPAVQFAGNANFKAAIFNGFVRFQSPSFGINTKSSMGTLPSDLAKQDFSDCQFDKPTSFRDAKFSTTYPILNGAVLHKNTDFSRFRTHNQNMTVAARAMADRNTLGHRSYRVATRRQSLSLPNILSMRLRRL